MKCLLDRLTASQTPHCDRDISSNKSNVPIRLQDILRAKVVMVEIEERSHSVQNQKGSSFGARLCSANSMKIHPLDFDISFVQVEILTSGRLKGSPNLNLGLILYGASILTQIAI